jgi:hypothetical protein
MSLSVRLTMFLFVWLDDHLLPDLGSIGNAFFTATVQPPCQQREEDVGPRRSTITRYGLMAERPRRPPEAGSHPSEIRRFPSRSAEHSREKLR